MSVRCKSRLKVFYFPLFAPLFWSGMRARWSLVVSRWGAHLNGAKSAAPLAAFASCHFSAALALLRHEHSDPTPAARFKCADDSSFPLRLTHRFTICWAREPRARNDENQGKSSARAEQEGNEGTIFICNLEGCKRARHNIKSGLYGKEGKSSSSDCRHPLLLWVAIRSSFIVGVSRECCCLAYNERTLIFPV